MNSETFDVQDLLLTEDSDSVKSVFKSSFKNDEDIQEEGKKEYSKEGAVLFNVSCIETAGERNHTSDEDEAAKGSVPKHVHKSEEEGEGERKKIIEEDDEEERKEDEEEERKEEDNDADMGNIFFVRMTDLKMSANSVGLINVLRRALGHSALPTFTVTCVFAKRGKRIMMMHWNISSRPIFGLLASGDS
jgi:hypothetical protein